MAYLGQGPFQEFTNPPTKDSFTGDGSTTAFDMSAEVASSAQNALEVYVDNVRQEPGTGKAFTLGPDGSNDTKRITFSAAPANGASIYVINDKTNISVTAPLNNDLNGTELILDGNGDTSITADTDNRIDFKLGGADHFHIGTSSGDTVFQNRTDAKDFLFNQYDGRTILEINDAGFVALHNGTTGSGELRIYEDDDVGSNYSGFKVGTQSADIDYVLPTADGTTDFKLTTDSNGTLSWTASHLPTSADGQALGSASAEWSDLFLADGGVINLGADQDTTLTHVADTGILLNSTRQLQFGDSGTYIHQSADGVLDLVSDTEIEINATTIDINGAVQISGTTTIAGNLIFGSATITEAQLEVLDGATVTTDELNLIDGGATVGTTAIADGDGLLINDAGTMRVSTVQTLAAYLDDEITAMPNLVTTAATTVGALDSGSITSGFTSIDVGAGAITTTGTGTIGNLVVDDVAVNGKVITMTGSSGDTFVTTVGTNGATSLVTVDTAAAAAHLEITADGTVDINSAGVLTLDSGAAINIEPASGSAILLDGTISVDAGVVTGATSVTSTAFVGDITGDVTGNADTATALATARTIGGTSFDGSGNIAVALAAVATSVVITDNESTNENNAIIFSSGGDVDGGTYGLESDGDLKYNPSTGKVTATGFIGSGADLTGLGLSSQVVSFTRNMGDGAGTQAISGVGFQPTAVLFLASVGGAGMASIGFQDSDLAGDSLADRHLMVNDEWDVNVYNAKAIEIVLASSVNYEGYISAYSSDGFTLTWAVRNSPSGTVKVRALCFR